MFDMAAHDTRGRVARDRPASRDVLCPRLPCAANLQECAEKSPPAIAAPAAACHCCRPEPAAAWTATAEALISAPASTARGRACTEFELQAGEVVRFGDFLRALPKTTEAPDEEFDEEEMMGDPKRASRAFQPPPRRRPTSPLPTEVYALLALTHLFPRQLCLVASLMCRALARGTSDAGARIVPNPRNEAQEVVQAVGCNTGVFLAGRPQAWSEREEAGTLQSAARRARPHVRARPVAMLAHSARWPSMTTPRKPRVAAYARREAGASTQPRSSSHSSAPRSAGTDRCAIDGFVMM